MKKMILSLGMIVAANTAFASAVSNIATAEIKGEAAGVIYETSDVSPMDWGPAMRGVEENAKIIQNYEGTLRIFCTKTERLNAAGRTIKVDYSCLTQRSLTGQRLPQMVRPL